MRKQYLMTAVLLGIAGALLWFATSDMNLFPQPQFEDSVIYVPRAQKISAPDPTWPENIKAAFDKTTRLDVPPQTTAYDLGNGAIIFFQSRENDGVKDILIQKVQAGTHEIIFAGTYGTCGSGNMATTAEGFVMHSDFSRCVPEGTIKDLYFDRNGAELGEVEQVGSGTQLIVSERDGKSYAVTLLYGKSDCGRAEGMTILAGVAVNGTEFKLKSPRPVPCAQTATPGIRGYEYANGGVKILLPSSGLASLRFSQPIKVDFEE
ncbi:MAG: hypothetical protein WC641_02240 [Patescibacteria group bacterium]